MPEISRFLGIVITMYFNDHDPAHFHAGYGNYEVKVFVDSGLVEGRFPKRALRMVLEWYEAHVAELEQDWALASEHKPLMPIAPLE